MLTIRSRRSERTCEGTSRRDFLRVGSLSTGAAALGGLSLPDLLRARASAATASKGTPKIATDTSVVLLWLGGGPTHIETFDPKPTAPVEYRSVSGAIDTNVDGIQLGGHFSQIAQHADKMAFVRSFAHKNSSHGAGTHLVMTGYKGENLERGGQGSTKPSFGAITARYRGESNAETGMPTYVRLGSIGYDGPGFLGKAYAPFETGGQARRNMDLTLDTTRIADRRSLLGSLDRINREADAHGLMQGIDAYEQQAYGLILGAAKKAFDVEQEERSTRKLYGNGDSELGMKMLTARRLCEAGCGFVTVSYGGWDMHGGIANGMKNRGPAVDQAVAGFIQDCAQRSLSEKILLVISGEFGRTPRINKNGGRDHWGPLCTLALSGGGLKMGQVIGESTANAEVPKSTAITPPDLMATVFHTLGLPQDLHFNDNGGRPTPMIVGGKPIRELV